MKGSDGKFRAVKPRPVLLVSPLNKVFNLTFLLVHSKGCRNDGEKEHRCDKDCLTGEAGPLVSRVTLAKIILWI